MEGASSRCEGRWTFNPQRLMRQTCLASSDHSGEFCDRPLIGCIVLSLAQEKLDSAPGSAICSCLGSPQGSLSTIGSPTPRDGCLRRGAWDRFDSRCSLSGIQVVFGEARGFIRSGCVNWKPGLNNEAWGRAEERESGTPCRRICGRGVYQQRLESSRSVVTKIWIVAGGEEW